MPQKLKKIRRLEGGECRSYGFIQHLIFNYIWYKETEGPVMIIYVIKQKCEGPFQVADTERAQINTIVHKVLYK
jgi:hypothetical protein